MKLLLQDRPDAASATLLCELFKVEQYADMALNYARMNASSTDYVLRTCDSGRAVAQGAAPVRAAVHSEEAAALLRACILLAADRRKVVFLRRGAAALQRRQVHEKPVPSP